MCLYWVLIKHSNHGLVYCNKAAAVLAYPLRSGNVLLNDSRAGHGPEVVTSEAFASDSLSIEVMFASGKVSVRCVGVHHAITYEMCGCYPSNVKCASKVFALGSCTTYSTFITCLGSVFASHANCKC